MTEKLHIIQLIISRLIRRKRVKELPINQTTSHNQGHEIWIQGIYWIWFQLKLLGKLISGRL